MPFPLEVIISGLNILLLKKGEAYQCCPESARLVSIDTSNESGKCETHAPYLTTRLSRVTIVNELEDPIVLPTEDGDQLAAWPLTGLGLCILAEQKGKTRGCIEVKEGPNHEELFDVTPSLPDCGIEASTRRRSGKGYLHQDLKTTKKPIDGRCSAIVEFPSYGFLHAQNIAQADNTDIQWKVEDKAMKFARELVWSAPFVKDRVYFRSLSNQSKYLKLKLREGVDSMQLSLTNFPPKILPTELGKLEHFNCFYKAAEVEPNKRIIPYPTSKKWDAITGASVICPTPILEYA